MNKALHGLKDLPIKLFINCKNSKRKDDKKAKVNANHIDHMNNVNGRMDDDHYDSANTKCDIISREEVYFTGKENIEGYACLVNVFLKQLMNSSPNSAIINIDNAEEFDE
jgi:hypothetical protein